MIKKRRSIKNKIFIIILFLFFIPLIALAVKAFLTYPFKSYKKITQYPDDKYVRNNHLPYYAGHTGVDYDLLKGEPILSAADGEVVFVKDGMPDGCEMKTSEKRKYGYGNYVIISHNNGLYTLYGHMKKEGVKVSRGQKVKSGDILGLGGNSGWSVGSDECGTFIHLHFEVRYQNSYGSIYNPYNLDTGCLFLGGCDKPQLPTQTSLLPEKNSQRLVSVGNYSINYLGWLDIFKDGDPETNKIAAGSFDGGTRSGLHTTANTSDGHIYYHEVWWDNDERGGGNILDRLYKLDPLNRKDKKILAMETGKFGGGEDDILAVTLQGDDKVYFYYKNRNNNQELGVLDPHPDSNVINNITTGDIDNDGKDELMLSVPTDDHVYLFDGWNGRNFTKKVGLLNAHDNNPKISAIATMDIDSNGYDELLVATEADDHIYEYYFDKSKLNKWYKPWDRGLSSPFVKQGYMDAHIGSNPKITNIAVGKFQSSEDHLAVTTQSDDHIYFYWGRNLNDAWGGIFNQKKFKNTFSWTEQPLISDLAVGDFDDSGDDELAVASYGDDHINFFGHGDGRGYVGYGGGGKYYQAELTGHTKEKINFKPGETREIWVEYKNTGTAAWFEKASKKISLRLDPQSRNSIFYDQKWQKENIPIILTKDIVKTGEKIKFKFKIKAPNYSREYQEKFALYLDNKKLANTNFTVKITVDGEIPRKISGLSGDKTKTDWVEIYTRDKTPSFKWEKAKDFLSGMAGYYIAIDDFTPDGGWGHDWWIGDVSSWTVPENLDDGWHTVAVTSKDILGNLNPLNTNREGDAPYLRFLIDTKAPSVPKNLFKSQKSAWDGNTSLSRRPYFSWDRSRDQGSGVEKYFIEIEDIDTNTRSNFIISQPDFKKNSVTWQVGKNLIDGEYQIRVSASDRAGNQSENALYNFTIDGDRAQGDTIILDSNKNVLVAEGTEQLTLTATLYNPDGYSGPELAGKQIDFAIIDENGVVGDTGNLSIVQDKLDGSYQALLTAPSQVGDSEIRVEAKCIDCQQQISATEKIYLVPGISYGNINLNTNPAAIDADGSSIAIITSDPITDSTGNLIADGELFTVSASAGAIITADSDIGTPGIQIFSMDGIVTFELRSEIWNGHEEAGLNATIEIENQFGTAAGSASVEMTDVQVPAKPIITSPLNDSFSNDNTPSLTGLAEKNSRVLIYKKKNSGAWGYHYYTYADNTGNFSYTFGSSLGDANWKFRVAARDAAGNTSINSDAVSVAIDTAKPTISNNLPTGIIYHRNETISANYQDNTGGSGIDVATGILKINGSTKPATVTATGISYNNTFPESNQTYNVYIEIKDKAGNAQTKSWTFNIQLFSYFLSSVGSGYKSSIIPNWPNSNGMVPSPSWWEPSFNDTSWGDQVFAANQPPAITPKADLNAEWIWGDNQVNSNETSLLRYRFNVPTGVMIDDAAIRLSAEDEAWGYIGYLNGNYFGKVPEQLSGGNPYTYGIQSLINNGQNLLAIQVSNDNDNRAGLSYSMTVKYHD